MIAAVCAVRGADPGPQPGRLPAAPAPWSPCSAWPRALVTTVT